jgi:GNAT superfamily N-acetyltransferase
VKTILLAQTDDEIRRCFAIMAELRPHLIEGEFVGRVRRQQRLKGYQLAFLHESGVVKCAAGFWVSECLAWGKYFFVDDLVTAAAARSQGHGQQLFDWLVAQARAQDCDQFHLDSGVQRFGAHRFYLAKRMDITAHHFGLKLR